MEVVPAPSGELARKSGWLRLERAWGAVVNQSRFDGQRRAAG